MLLQLSHSFYYFFYNFYYNFQYYSQHNLRHPFKIKLLLPIIVLQVLCSTGYFKWEAALFLRPFFISFVKWHTESAFAPPSNISGDMHAPHAPQSRLHTHAVQTDTHSHTHIQAHVSTCVMCVCLATVFDCAACLPPGNKLNDLLNDVHFMQLDRARVISSENERGRGTHCRGAGIMCRLYSIAGLARLSLSMAHHQFQRQVESEAKTRHRTQLDLSRHNSAAEPNYSTFSWLLPSWDCVCVCDCVYEGNKTTAWVVGSMSAAASTG